MQNKMWNKLFEGRIWKRIYLERMGEPLIYNIASLFALLGGSVRTKIKYDCVPRQPYAFSILAAADHAKSYGIDKVTIVEFGVAAGAGLMNMCWIAEQVTRETGVRFDILGFDSGEGMPPPRDYRDHPEKYFTGDFPPVDRQALVDALPPNARIYFGPIDVSLQRAKSEIDSVIAFVSIDVDYYWSTRQCLEIFTWDAARYLPSVPVYLDDIQDVDDNEYCGEMLAVKEFNTENQSRKITVMNCLPHWQIFKNSVWQKQVHYAHILDHEFRTVAFNAKRRTSKVILSNPHL
jgi:hypothetical protein